MGWRKWRGKPQLQPQQFSPYIRNTQKSSSQAGSEGHWSLSPPPTPAINRLGGTARDQTMIDFSVQMRKGSALHCGCQDSSMWERAGTSKRPSEEVTHRKSQFFQPGFSAARGASLTPSKPAAGAVCVHSGGKSRSCGVSRKPRGSPPLILQTGKPGHRAKPLGQVPRSGITPTGSQTEVSYAY